jgi:hypothetical protein
MRDWAPGDRQRGRTVEWWGEWIEAPIGIEPMNGGLAGWFLPLGHVIQKN